MRGKLLGSAQLASGRFAMIDDGLSLVPWRPVIEREVGREVFGVMRGNDIPGSWGAPEGLALPCKSAALRVAPVTLQGLFHRQFPRLRFSYQ